MKVDIRPMLYYCMNNLYKIDINPKVLFSTNSNNLYKLLFTGKIYAYVYECIHTSKYEWVLPLSLQRAREGIPTYLVYDLIIIPNNTILTYRVL
jgi:hypothetical protein